MTPPYTDCSTRLITWRIPADLDEVEVLVRIGQVRRGVVDKVGWLRNLRLSWDEGGMLLEATVTGKNQWMVYRRGRLLARKLVRRLGVMLSEPDVCRLPEHPNRRAASAAASRARWGGGSETFRRTAR